MTVPPADAAYQGAPGAFSEDAARAMLGPRKVLRPFPSLAGVFAALAEGAVQAAVLPMENSLAGAVPGVADLIAREPVRIVAERAHPIAHAIIGPRGATLESIDRVRSHPMALAQCEQWFRRHPHISPVPEFDTAGAVEQVIAGGALNEAAIAGRRAAAVYGGVVLEDDVQDEADNFTRFVLVEHARRQPRLMAQSKTSLVCVLRNEPGALFNALRSFAEQSLNLSRIESRPIPEAPFEYCFHLDIAPAPDVDRLREAIAALRRCSRSVRVLGVYPADENRREAGQMLPESTTS